MCETQVRTVSLELLSLLNEVNLRLRNLKDRMEQLEHVELIHLQVREHLEMVHLSRFWNWETWRETAAAPVVHALLQKLHDFECQTQFLSFSPLRNVFLMFMALYVRSWLH